MENTQEIDEIQDFCEKKMADIVRMAIDIYCRKKLNEERGIENNFLNIKFEECFGINNIYTDTYDEIIKNKKISIKSISNPKDSTQIRLINKNSKYGKNFEKYKEKFRSGCDYVVLIRYDIIELIFDKRHFHVNIYILSSKKIVETPGGVKETVDGISSPFHFFEKHGRLIQGQKFPVEKKYINRYLDD